MNCAAMPVAAAKDVRPKMLGYVDGLRALASLFVLLAHTWFEPSNGFYREPYLNHLGLSYGHVAVDAFIVLSGFVIGLPAARNGMRLSSTREFLRRRCQRILPPYYGALFLCVAFILVFAHRPTGTVWDNALPLTWSHVAANALLLHDVPGIAGGSISYQFWSVAVEFHIYGIAPLIFIGMRRLGDSCTLGLALLFGLCVHLAAPCADPFAPWLVELFTMGAVAARLVTQRSGDTKRLRRPGVALLGLTAALIVFLGNATFRRNLIAFDVVIGLGVAMILAGLYPEESLPKCERTLIHRILSSRGLVAIGGISYSLYLVHPAVLHAEYLILHHLHAFSSAQTFALLLGASPVVIALACAFHLAFERPFMASTQRRRGEGLCVRGPDVPSNTKVPLATSGLEQAVQ